MSNDRNVLIRPEVFEQRSDQDDPARRRVSRRGVLMGGAGAAGGLAVGALALPGTRAQEATPAATPDAHEMAGMTAAAPTNEGFTYFVPYQAAIVSAAAARLIPSDELGPGAKEAGVVFFIDRQLASYEVLPRPRLRARTVRDGAPTQGDQSGLDMRDRFRLGIQGMEAYAQQLYQTGLRQPHADQQDRILSGHASQGIPDTFDGTSIQSAALNPALRHRDAAMRAPGAGGSRRHRLLRSAARTHASPGFFADPVHGGNRDMVGWKLIGFPGAQLSYADEILNYGQPFTGPFISLAAVPGASLGRGHSPWPRYPRSTSSSSASGWSAASSPTSSANAPPA